MKIKNTSCTYFCDKGKLPEPGEALTMIYEGEKKMLLGIVEKNEEC